MYLIAAGWISWLADPANWLTILQVGVGLGFVIFVHELGHFLVAKACGVKCEKFYLGFDIYGLKLAKFQRGETEYGIGILPLGGYVKMLGQDDNPARMAEESRRARAQADVDPALASADRAPPLTHGDLPPEPVSDPHAPYDPRSYMAQSVPKRMAIISAGVIMNVIFAFVMSSVAYSLGVKEAQCVVGAVVPAGAAWKANMQPGDVVRRVGKIENPRFRDLQMGVSLGDLEQGIQFDVERPSEERSFELTLHPDSSLGVPMIGILGPWSTPQLLKGKDDPTAPNSPAREAQPEFKPGDTVVAIGDEPTKTRLDINRLLAAQRDKTVKVTVQRAPKSEQQPGAVSDEKDNAPPPTEQVVIDVAPTPLRDLGLAMTMGPIAGVQDDSPAAEAGIKLGDRLTLVDGQPAGNPLTLPERMRKAALAGQTVRLTLQREVEGKTEPVSVEIKPRVPALNAEDPVSTSPMSVPALGIAYKVLSTVTEVVPGSPAAAADIRPGDKVVRATLTPPAKQKQAEGASKKNEQREITIKFSDKDPAWPWMILEALTFLDPDTKVQLKVLRDEKERTVELGIGPMKDEQGNPMYTPTRGLIFAPLLTTRVAESFREALQMGGQQTVEDLLLVYRFLRKIVQQQISVRLLGGPVEIFRQAGMSAEEGIAKFLLFLSLLSANLAVVNFLPIPVLDGGHFVFLTYELIRGKPASERVILVFTYAGLIFLLSLMVFLLGLDTGLIPRR